MEYVKEVVPSVVPSVVSSDDDNTCRVVIKASGLAAGKGVVLPRNQNEAVAAINAIMVSYYSYSI